MSTAMQVRREWPFGRFFDVFEPDFGRVVEGFAPLVPRHDGRVRIEEEMQDGHLVIRAELPGIDPHNDVKATYKDGILEVVVPMPAEPPRPPSGWTSPAPEPGRGGNIAGPPARTARRQ